MNLVISQHPRCLADGLTGMPVELPRAEPKESNEHAVRLLCTRPDVVGNCIFFRVVAKTGNCEHIHDIQETAF